MTDPELIDIEEWCEWMPSEEAGCEAQADQMLITAAGEIEWYCGEHGEIRLAEEREK